MNNNLKEVLKKRINTLKEMSIKYKDESERFMWLSRKCDKDRRKITKELKKRCSNRVGIN